MRSATVVLVLACVVLAGCSQLASPVNEPTTPTIEPTESTPVPPRTSETRTQSTTRTQTTTVTTTTQTATAIPTPPPTRTPVRPPTATATPILTATTTTATTMRTASPMPESASLTIVTIDAPNETVTFRNSGERPLNLDGYVVDFDDGQHYTFPRYILAPGATVTVHTGRGDSAGSELYAGFFFPVINAQGDTLLVVNSRGEIVIARRVPATPTDS